MSKKRKNTVVNEVVEAVEVEALETVVNEVVEAVETKTVCNVSNAPHVIFGCTVPAKGEYTPTEKDMEDKRGFMRLENAVNQGKLEWR
jgi:hypothetical protein